MKPFVAIDAAPCGGSRSGGAATLSEFAIAMDVAGARVALTATHGRWWLRSQGCRGPLMQFPIIQWETMKTLPPEERLRFRTKRLALRPVLRRASQVVDWVERLTVSRNYVSGNAAIFVSSAHPNRGRARAFPEARTVLNHAGAPETMMEWWLPGGSGDEQFRAYRDRVRSYSFVLFQAFSHARDAIDSGAVSAQAAVVLHPSCDEIAMSLAVRAPSPFVEGRRAVVYVGSLQRRKDQESAIRAFHLIATRHGDVDLHLVGEGEASTYGLQMLALVESLGLNGRVRFWGHRSDHERFLAHAAVVLQTSRSEGVSRTLREGAYLGKPTVATALSGTVELFGQLGAWLCAPGSIEEISEAISDALGGRGAVERGQAARERYLKEWSREQYLSEVSQLSRRWGLT